MSYLAASDPRDLWAIAGSAAAFAGALGWWSRHDSTTPGQIVSRCVDGTVIGVRNRSVRRRPGRRRALLAAPARALREDLEPGDLTYLRLREGRTGEGAWVVEGLDPGEESFGIHWEFETAEAALAAYRLLDERIVRPPLDAEGRPVKLADREFDSLWSESPAIAGAFAAPRGAGTP